MISISALIDRAHDAHEAALLSRGISTAEIEAADEADRVRLKHVRGFAKEQRVLLALAAAPLPRWIVGVRGGGSREDRIGADVVVLCDDHHPYRIQIKSSIDGARRFIEEGRRRGRTSPIGMVVVTDSLGDRQIVVRVLAALIEMRAARAAELAQRGGQR
ncbi:hypothetical protein [Sorangium sp. So ce388]|uniref:hypothetical protein n=1 Tax=Sorangium sp. So ce388 TaxID=3133309 RepID=UPI003F5BCF6A